MEHRIIIGESHCGKSELMVSMFLKETAPEVLLAFHGPFTQRVAERCEELFNEEDEDKAA